MVNWFNFFLCGNCELDFLRIKQFLFEREILEAVSLGVYLVSLIVSSELDENFFFYGEVDNNWTGFIG